MSGFTESNITLDFPSTGKWFRFQQSEPYASLSGYSFKEMDACWVDDSSPTSRIVYGIELKDYTSAGSLNNSQSRVWNVVKKTVDTLQMLLSAKYQNSFGQTLESCKSVDLHTNISSLLLITIVDIPASNTPIFSAFKDECCSILRPYGAVWDSIHIIVLTKDQARRRFPFVK